MAIAGAALIAGGIIYGSVTLGSLGADVKTVPFGQTMTFSGSWRASIYTTQPPTSPTSHPPACSVTTTDGRGVTLKSATPFEINTKRHLESSYGFDVTRGTTYRVTCGTTSDTGEFGVIEVPFTAQVISIAIGIIGALAILASVVRWMVLRRRNRSRQVLR